MVRPTKKQQELLVYIEKFIGQYGYSPSYREIMTGCNYNSVATVALHIRSLIARGQLRKRDRSARSLEVVGSKAEVVMVAVKPREEKWLISRIEAAFVDAEKSPKPVCDHLYVLVGSLKILGFDDAARAFMARLNDLENQPKV